MRNTLLKGMENGESLGTVTGSPETSREREGGSSDTLCTLDVNPCTTLPSPPGTEPSVQALISLRDREERWEVAVVLQRQGVFTRAWG